MKRRMASSPIFWAMKRHGDLDASASIPYTSIRYHWGIEVEDRDSYVAKIEANGGTIISEPREGALKFRAPDGTVAEIVGVVRYKKKAEKEPASPVGMTEKAS
jgi:predicted enzyme related to lactoylglutathione lyase